MGQESTVASDGEGGGGRYGAACNDWRQQTLMDFKINDWSVYDCKLGNSNEGDT